MKKFFTNSSLPATRRLTLIGLFFALTVNISCLKKQDLSEQNLGPAADPQEVQKQMGDAIGVLDYNDIKENESYSIFTSATLEETQSLSLARQSVRVLAKNIPVLKIMQTYEDYQVKEDSFQNTEKELNFDVPKSCSKYKPIACDAPVLTMDYIAYAIYLCRTENISCHNFTVRSIQQSLNPQFFDSKICPSNTSCSVSARQIEFDVANGNVLNDQGQPSKIHFKFVVVPQLPFLSKVLQSCNRKLIQYGSRKILAEFCDTIVGATSGN